jgi:hypothetical protein
MGYSPALRTSVCNGISPVMTLRWPSVRAGLPGSRHADRASHRLAALFLGLVVSLPSRFGSSSALSELVRGSDETAACENGGNPRPMLDGSGAHTVRREQGAVVRLLLGSPGGVAGKDAADDCCVHGPSCRVGWPSALRAAATSVCRAPLDRSSRMRSSTASSAGTGWSFPPRVRQPYGAEPEACWPLRALARRPSPSRLAIIARSSSLTAPSTSRMNARIGSSGSSRGTSRS